MKHPIETAAEQIRATAAEATETLNLGGAWPAGLPLETVILLTLVVIAVIAVTVVAGIPIVLVLMERKVSAYFQNRLGPTRVGPWGLLVTLADGIKLLFKEDMVPPSSDRKLFRLAPYVVFAASFAVVAVIPPFQSTVIGNMDLGLFLYLAISSLIVLGIIMAGWASNSKYSLFGALRAAAQIVSYEIPLGLAVLMIVMATGTLNMQHLVMDQADGIHAWYMFRHPFLFIGAFIYFLSAVAEVNRTPFDLPEAESEIVAGYHTEYSGIRFAYFFLAEYANAFIVSAICATLFMGGWAAPFPFLSGVPGVVWFLGKTMFLVFIMMWLRWTLPRVRVDQLMSLCWKYFLPISFVNILGAGVLALLEREEIGAQLGGMFLSAEAVSWIAFPFVLALLGWFARWGTEPVRRPS
ncbi:MAG: NADH-quinone oxidoreductase subunit NuoH [Candidatus Poribacteria bacterium]|nr:NADH-quinone oxidoreductase subunit NuoH [Candidatus Poribacteria bacterium]